MRHFFINTWIILLFISLVDLNVVSTKICPPGYHGSFCNMTCRYPNYGEDCQRECLCEEEQCDYIIGCFGKNTTNVMPVENTTQFLHTSASVNSFSGKGNNLTDMPPNCIVHKNKAMLISICILVATFFVIMGIYLKIKKNEIK